MIIDAKTIIITMVMVVIAFAWGLKFVRKFALQIAEENHAAVADMNHDEEEQRRKKERAADAAGQATTFTKGGAMLTVPKAPSANPEVKNAADVA